MAATALPGGFRALWAFGRNPDIAGVFGRHFAILDGWSVQMSPEGAGSVKMSPENEACVRKTPKNTGHVRTLPDNTTRDNRPIMLVEDKHHATID